MFGTEGLPGQSTKRDSFKIPFYHSLICSTFSIYVSLSATPPLQPRHLSSPRVFPVGLMYSMLASYIDIFLPLPGLREMGQLHDLRRIGHLARPNTHNEKEDQ